MHDVHLNNLNIGILQNLMMPLILKIDNLHVGPTVLQSAHYLFDEFEESSYLNIFYCCGNVYIINIYLFNIF